MYSIYQSDINCHSIFLYLSYNQSKGDWIHKYQYPALFRLDRIVARKDTGERFNVIYSSRFEEGEFRKRTQFMFPGKLLKLQFKYYGSNVDAVLDRLPTAKVVQEKEKYQLIEAEVYGTGIVMWLLSQGKNVEVIRPESLREDMRKVLSEMLGYYE
ncbi:MAG: WYL domain-containing protein [Lachnospiraceae bacterium]|nr:WYL domain-containing protein [Lachnospiraceae bacterium]